MFRITVFTCSVVVSIMFLNMVQTLDRKIQYDRSVDLDGMTCLAEDVTLEEESKSPISCLTKCTGKPCETIFYNDETRMCTGCTRRYTSCTELPSSSGTMAYRSPEHWIVIQRRLSASDFFKTWEEYKTGFGDLNGNFWLGNEKIWALTQTGTWKLRIELRCNGESGYAENSYFAIGNEASNYVLTVSGYTGNVSDSLTPRHNGMQFSTHDRDNDIRSEDNCAEKFVGGWWYSDCHNSNLNGLYGNVENGKGLNWYPWQDKYSSMDTTEMKINRVA